MNKDIPDHLPFPQLAKCGRLRLKVQAINSFGK